MEPGVPGGESTDSARKFHYNIKDVNLNIISVN
jgi:hypothetical protein